MDGWTLAPIKHESCKHNAQDNRTRCFHSAQAHPACLGSKSRSLPPPIMMSHCRLDPKGAPSMAPQMLWASGRIRLISFWSDSHKSANVWPLGFKLNNNFFKLSGLLASGRLGVTIFKVYAT